MRMILPLAGVSVAAVVGAIDLAYHIGYIRGDEDARRSERAMHRPVAEENWILRQREDALRCPSMFRGGRCERPRCHTGNHNGWVEDARRHCQWGDPVGATFSEVPLPGTVPPTHGVRQRDVR